MLRLISLFGLFALLALCYALSHNRRAVSWRQARPGSAPGPRGQSLRSRTCVSLARASGREAPSRPRVAAAGAPPRGSRDRRGGRQGAGRGARERPCSSDASPADPAPAWFAIGLRARAAEADSRQARWRSAHRPGRRPAGHRTPAHGRMPPAGASACPRGWPAISASDYGVRSPRDSADCHETPGPESPQLPLLRERLGALSMRNSARTRGYQRSALRD